MSALAEMVVEKAALGWLEATGWQVAHGRCNAAGKPGAEQRDPDCRDGMLKGRLRELLARLNPELPSDALEDMFDNPTSAEAPSLLERNRATHWMLVDGVTVENPRTVERAQAGMISVQPHESIAS